MNTARTVNFYMANLGSEVSRIIDAKTRKNLELARSSHARAKDILRKIANDSSMAKRKVEMEKLKDAIDSLLAEKTDLNINPETLKSYFYPFAARILSSSKRE